MVWSLGDWEGISGHWEGPARGGLSSFLPVCPSLNPSLPLSFSFLLSQELEALRGRGLDPETQLMSKAESSMLSGFHHIESEKTQEPLVVIELILEILTLMN